VKYNVKSNRLIQQQLKICFDGKLGLEIPIVPTLITHDKTVNFILPNNETREGTVTIFTYMEKNINLVEGLVAYTNLFSEEELLEMENHANHDLILGRKGKLVGESYIYSKSREMLLYGYHYQYFPTDKRRKGVWNNVPVQPFPAWGHNISQRLLDNNVVPDASDSLIINYYPQFGAIPPHVDHSFYSPNYKY
jgi:hypothetical protein